MDVVLIRHAQSEYNFRIVKAWQNNPDIGHQNLQVKFDGTLVDAHLSELGKLQCSDNVEKMHHQPISLVICSALRRATETAWQLFKDHPNKPRIIIQPLLTEMLLSSCDLSSKEITKPYLAARNIDSSFLDTLEDEIWPISICRNVAILSAIIRLRGSSSK